MPRSPPHRPSRSRSRSPHRSSHSRHSHRDRDRDRDRRDHHHRSSTHHHHHHYYHHHSKPQSNPDQPLPFSARPLLKTDLPQFTPLFAHYLTLQKSLSIHTLSPTETKGRWKSFLHKWNRGDLAPGWYDPAVFSRCVAEWDNTPPPNNNNNPETTTNDPPPSPAATRIKKEQDDSDADSSATEYGPTLPPPPTINRLTNPTTTTTSSTKQSATLPTLHDLQLRAEASLEERDLRRLELAAERQVDRKLQKARLDELVPRAEAGTRERMLEKKKEVNEKMRGFRDKSPGGDEVADDELVGGAGGGVEEYKRLLEREKQRTSERQLRRDEIARAKAAEREERVRAYREREEETVGKLKELARLRFG